MYFGLVEEVLNFSYKMVKLISVFVLVGFWLLLNLNERRGKGVKKCCWWLGF